MQKIVILATWLLLSTTHIERCREGVCTRVDMLRYPIIQVVKTFVTREECVAIQSAVQQAQTHAEAQVPPPRTTTAVHQRTTYPCLQKEDS